MEKEEALSLLSETFFTVFDIIQTDTIDELIGITETYSNFFIILKFEQFNVNLPFFIFLADAAIHFHATDCCQFLLNQLQFPSDEAEDLIIEFPELPEEIEQFLNEIGKVGTEPNSYKSMFDWIINSDFDLETVPCIPFDALYIAAQLNIYSIIRYLLNAGCNINQISVANTIIFNGAVLKNDKELLSILKKYKVPQVADGFGKYPLHCSIKTKDPEIVKFLLEIGGDPSCKDSNGYTPLHLAAKKGCCAIADILIGYGAPLDEIDNGGHTPMHLAANFGQVKMAKLLYEAGAKPDVLDFEDRSPINYAYLRKKKDCLSFFQSIGMDNGNIYFENKKEKGIHGKKKKERKIQSKPYS